MTGAKDGEEERERKTVNGGRERDRIRERNKKGRKGRKKGDRRHQVKRRERSRTEPSK